MKILFLHGWQSVPGGVKPTYLVQHGHAVISPKLPDDDFAGAVAIAQNEFDKHQPDVVVGSSRGGAVAMNISSGQAKLVLLCPAWKTHGSARTVKPGTIILHSRADDVVPFGDSEELVRNSGLPASTLIVVGADHRLADREPLKAMLNACEQAAQVAGSRTNNPVVLETERLILRQWTGTDVDPFYAICSDPRVMQFVGNGQAWSQEQSKCFIDRAIAQSQQLGFCQWPLVHKNDGTPIGFCGFVPAEGGAEIGWRLAFQHWGKGLATEAAQAALKYGFETLGFERITATVQSGNRASLRVVEKLGMHQDGTLQRNGREVLVFAVTSPRTPP